MSDKLRMITSDDEGDSIDLSDFDKIRLIDRRLILVARKTNLRLVEFFNLYVAFGNYVMMLSSGKIKANPVSLLKSLRTRFDNATTRIRTVIDRSEVVMMKRFLNQILSSDKITNESDPKKIVSSSLFKIYYKRFMFSYSSMIANVLSNDIRDKYPKIGYSARTRIVNSIPVMLYKLKTEKEIEQEKFEEEHPEQAQKLKLIKEESKRVIEEAAEENGHELESSRVLGKIVNVGMKPVDRQKMNVRTKPLRKELNNVNSEIKEKKLAVRAINRKRSELAKDPETPAEEIEGLDEKALELKSEVMGRYSGEWENENGDVGTWEAVKESGYVPRMVTSSMRTAYRVKNTSPGLWTLKVVGRSWRRVYKITVDENGKVSDRRSARPVVEGSLYLGVRLNGWIRDRDGVRISMNPGEKSQTGLADEKDEIRSKINEVMDDYDRYIYDEEGKPVDAQEFMKKRRKRLSKEKAMKNIHKIGPYLKSLDTVDERVVDRVKKEKGVKWVALSDSKVQDDDQKITKMLPVVDVDGVDIVADGTFKGYNMDELVNKADRLITGTANVIDDTGAIRPIEIERENGEMDYLVKFEPYVTMTKDSRMMIVLPRAKEVIPDETKPRQKILNTPDYKIMKELASMSSSCYAVKHVGTESEKRTTTSTATFVLAPRDLDYVKDLLGSVSMSSAVSKVMEDYYDKRRKFNETRLSEKYADFDESSIPGLKTSFVDDEGNEHPFKLQTFQKKAIAYIDKRGHGLVGLDTGLGKSITSIATLLKWRAEGVLREGGRNGKVLYVVPASLQGNIPTEIRKFCEDPEDVLKDVDIVTYDGFSNMDEKELEDYGAVFYDEAQRLKNAVASHPSKAGRRALKLDHPKKVLWTASVMEKSPEDLYNLTMISDNKYSMDTDRAMKERSAFLSDTCEMVRGKAVSVRADPLAKNKMAEWVKANCLYVDKRQVAEEIGLPKVTPRNQQNKSVFLQGRAKEKYAEVASRISTTLGKMKEMYRDKKLTPGDVHKAVAKHGVMTEIIELKEISNDVEIYERKHLARKLSLEWYGKKDTKDLTPEERLTIKKELDKRVPKTPNPKIEQTKQIVKEAAARGRRTCVWTDQPSFAVKTARELASEFSSKMVAVCLANRIIVYNSDGSVADYEGVLMDKMCMPSGENNGSPCREKADFGPSSKYQYPDGEFVPTKQWQKYIMDYVIAPNPNIGVVVLTSSYSKGHNIQWCSNVVHLDRDNWNNEEMKQRTARCWRQGQKDSVEVSILDSVLEDDVDDGIAINEVQKWMQEMEDDLFDYVIRKSMGEEMSLGSVTFKDTKETIVDRKLLRHALLPTSSNASKLSGYDPSEKD